MRHDLLSDALSVIQNAENVGQESCSVPNSKLVKAVLEAVEKAGYIGQLKASGSAMTVSLVGKINAIKSVRPRFAVRKDEFEKYEKRYLPSPEMGAIIVSTPQGLMTHREAKEKGIGGRLLAFVY
jgi:small subunit ribosomal protein S8